MQDSIKAVLFDMDGVLIDARDWHFQALNEEQLINAIEPFGFKTSTIMLKQLKKCSNLPQGTVITELKSGGWISCTKLQELNKQMIQRREQLQHLSYKAQLVACEAIASAPILSTLEDWVCHLDCTQCIGYTSRQHAWSCPTILDLQDNEGSGFDIKQSKP